MYFAYNFQRFLCTLNATIYLDFAFYSFAELSWFPLKRMRASELPPKTSHCGN